MQSKHNQDFLLFIVYHGGQVCVPLSREQKCM